MDLAWKGVCSSSLHESTSAQIFRMYSNDIIFMVFHWLNWCRHSRQKIDEHVESLEQGKKDIADLPCISDVVKVTIILSKPDLRWLRWCMCLYMCVGESLHYIKNITHVNPALASITRPDKTWYRRASSFIVLNTLYQIYHNIPAISIISVGVSGKLVWVCGRWVTFLHKEHHSYINPALAW